MAKLPQLDLCAKRVLLVALLAAFGCKEEVGSENLKDLSKEEVIGAQPPDAPKTGKFSIKEIKVAASQTVFQNEALPKDKEISACVKKHVAASSAFAEKGRAVTGTVTYDYQKREDHFVIALFGILEEAGQDPVSAEVGTRLKSTDPLASGKSENEVALLVCERFSKKIAALFEVSTADDARLLALADEMSDADALLAIVREIRERNIESGLPLLTKNLEHEDSRVAVASAAGLAKMKHDEVRPEVLKLAERLSRDRDPQYVPMMHILADFGGEDVREYLQTVAKSHDADAVREIAAEALKRLDKN